MTPSDSDPRDGGQNVAPSLASAWLWKPWYAKLWWVGAVTFWLIVITAPKGINPITSSAGLYMAMVFHPFALLWYIAFRAAWCWRELLAFPSTLDTEADINPDGGDDELYSGDRIGFHRPLPMSFLSDPTDIRSPMNPANPAYIGRHRR